MSTILFLTAEIDCGEVLENRDIKDNKIPSVRLVGLRRGLLLLEFF